VVFGVTNIGAAVAVFNVVALLCFGIVGAALTRASISSASELPSPSPLAQSEKNRLLG
jgi:hypothetical protein